jgi:hypothetical protein
MNVEDYKPLVARLRDWPEGEGQSSIHEIMWAAANALGDDIIPRLQSAEARVAALEAKNRHLEALLSEVLHIAGPQKYRRRRLIKLARKHFSILLPPAAKEEVC